MNARLGLPDEAVIDAIHNFFGGSHVDGHRFCTLRLRGR
jgi:hypothetical protein